MCGSSAKFLIGCRLTGGSCAPSARVVIIILLGFVVGGATPPSFETLVSYYAPIW
jgi:hypothetical protein